MHAGEESSEAGLRRLAELGRLLASAEGYLVLDPEGRPLGRVDHVRYERHADHPDEIVVRRRRLWRRKLVVPFQSVAAVDPGAGIVRLHGKV